MAMTVPTWFLKDSRAALQAGPLTATLDLARPALGLGAVRCHGQPLAMALLALETPASAQLDGSSLLEGYVQRDNLVASYGESAGWPVRVDGRWRADAEGPAAVLDLVVSVRTSLLDSLPEMAVRNTVTASSVMVSVDSGRFEPWSIDRGPDARRGRPQRLGCVLFRLPGDAWSCAAMVHPADFARAEMTAGTGEPGALRLAYHLFSQRLEKGVILRARVRCLLAPRDEDLSFAAAHYASFLAAEPPLGL